MYDCLLYTSLACYLDTLKEELKSFARVSGHDNIHDVTLADLCTTSEEIARYTGCLLYTSMFLTLTARSVSCTPYLPLKMFMV